MFPNYKKKHSKYNILLDSFLIISFLLIVEQVYTNKGVGFLIEEPLI